MNEVKIMTKEGPITIRRTGPNNAIVGGRADLTRECICKPRDWRCYADDDGADFDCPHHGHDARVWLAATPTDKETT